jgi:hypothetical protein
LNEEYEFKQHSMSPKAKSKSRNLSINTSIVTKRSQTPAMTRTHTPSVTKPDDSSNFPVRHNSLTYQGNIKSPTFTTTQGSPLQTSTMREPDSPSNKQPFKVTVNFERLGSNVAETPLMKLLAKRKNMTAKEFMKA